MSGHSHWAGIKHKKGVEDRKRAGVFTKVARLVTVAAREGGGGNPDTNFRLRLAIDQARAVNMPKENIERAIARGTGASKDDLVIEEAIYEGYGPGNVAMLIKAATDNKNRAVSEIKNILTKGGGKMVVPGAVGFMFESVGEIVLSYADEAGREQQEWQAIEAGAQDIENDPENQSLLIYTRPEDLQKVAEALKAAGITAEAAGLSYRATQKVSVDAETRSRYTSLVEKLEDYDDVQAVYDNLI